MSVEQNNRSDGWSEVYMDSPEVKVLGEVRNDLTDLRTDFSDNIVEKYGAKTDTQYYQLGKTTIEQGDIYKIHDAIDKGENMTHAHISILGGADQLFMSETRGQQVLDAEIARLESRIASRTKFSSQNKAVIQNLIAELKNPTKHKDLAVRFPRVDGRSNVGNAKLIAARMASGYGEILESLYKKIDASGSDFFLSCDIAWDACVIGTSGLNLYDRKIDVSISIQQPEPVVTEEPVVPEEPEIPVVPEEPEVPVVPEEPEIPVVPEEPEVPVVPEEPEIPVVPEVEYLSDSIRMLVGTAFLQVRQSHSNWNPPSDYRYGSGSTNPGSLWSSYDTHGSESVAIYDAVGSKVFEIVLRNDAPPLLGLGSDMTPVDDVDQLLGVLDDIGQMDRNTFKNFLVSLQPNGVAVIDNLAYGLQPDMNKVDFSDVKIENISEFDPTIVSLYANLGDENLKKLHANLLHLPNTKLLDALRDQDTALIVDQLLLVSDATTRMSLMELLFSLELNDRLSGIDMRQLMNGLQQVQDTVLKKQLMYTLFVGDIYGAMSLVGMKKGSEYVDNAITDTLNDKFLKNIAERLNRVFHSWFDVLSGNILLSNEFGQKAIMPADVKNAYMMFVSDGIRGQIKDKLPLQNIPSRKIQSQGNYAIISKTDGHMYLFDGDHRLVSRKSVLLGQDRSDNSFRVHDYPVSNDRGQTVNFAPPKRNPRGLYSIEAKGPKPKIGRYMQFFPKDNQIDYGPLNRNGDRKWTIGIHELYADSYVDRDAAIRSGDVNKKFVSNGCINMHNDYYAEVWDHLTIGSSVYVS